MYHLEFITQLINVKTIILVSLTYILLKFITDHYFHKPRWVQFTAQFPGPRVYPIIGTIVTLLMGAKMGFGKLFVNYMMTYGPTFRIWIGNQLTVVISDVNDVQALLTNSNCLDKKDAFSALGIIFGKGLPIAPAEIWKHKRKEYQPFFTKTNQLALIDKINEVNEKYVEKMKKEVDGLEFDLEHYMNDLSFDTIMKTHLNYDYSDEERQQFNIYQKLDEAFVRVCFNCLFPLSFVKVIVEWLYPVDIVKTIRKAHNFIDKVVNSLQTSETNLGAEEEIEAKSLKKETFAQSYVRKLFKVEKELNETDLVRSELVSIILAGSESTGYTMASCFFTLAAYPEIQEKVYKEIHQVFGDDERSIELSDLNKFPYVDQVIKETQRFFSVIPIITRTVQKDTKIGSHTYPAGGSIIANIGGIHHNPKIYPNPYRFNPENFTPEAIEKRHRFSFIPFSAGSRNCIGKEYAEISMKLRLVSFLRMFTFYTTTKLEDMKIRAGSVERLAGYPVSIKLRKKSTKFE